MAASKFLAFDLGAESGRAVLGSLDRGKLALEEIHRFANPHGVMLGRLQWNLLGQWEELKTGLRKAAPKTLEGGFSGIGVDTWGLDCALLSRCGDVLRNPTMYRDSATEGVMERTFARISKQRIFQTTGIQFMRINTLYQLLAMQEKGSQILESADTMLMIPDLFHYLFSGVKKNELSIASTSQMYDPRLGNWATGMVKELGLPERILGEIVPSGTVLGKLLPEIARECEIEPMPVIAPGSHDTASAVAATPAEEGSTWCYISSGTWSLMGVEINQPIVTDQALQLGYTNEMGVGGKVRFLKNIMGLWLIQECRRQWQKEGYDHGYTELTAMAERAAPFGPLVDPNHDSFLAPGEMVDKINRYCKQTGQRIPGHRGDYVRTCLESLALTYRRTADGLAQTLGRPLSVIHIVGGGSQNELLNQMTADACGCPVVAGPIEATAIGNILAQAMAVGQIANLNNARAIVRDSFKVVRYVPTQQASWDKAYQRYQKIISKSETKSSK